MISFLRGILTSRSSSSCELDVSGVGYMILMTQDALSALPAVGQEALVTCRMIVSDSGVSLYGFSSHAERELFDALITVSGIGPKTALAALSCMASSDMIAAISAQDVKALSKIPGVGKKSASRIALELKDKFKGEGMPDHAGSGTMSGKGVFSGVIEALSSMGFTSDEIDLALEDACADDPESVTLQKALKKLARRH